MLETTQARRAPGAAELTLRVRDRTDVAEDVVALELATLDGAQLPPWTPGAHIDVVLDPDARLVRQYSLCGDPADRARWRIAVLRRDDGRGGSRRVHDALRPGHAIGVGLPRNRFPLLPAESYLFLAGGIGVTPLLPMATAVARGGAAWRLVHSARGCDRLAFAGPLARLGGDRVVLHDSARDGRLDLDRLLGATAPGTAVYACGPEALLATLEARRSARPAWSLHVERFASSAAVTTADTAFEVVVAGTGAAVPVQPGTSVLEALERAGYDVPSSCREGTCGTCETAVIDGVPDHRDDVLDADERERERGDTMMLCVSRARTSRLTLDL